ncbi:CARDB domain-containing protein [Nocardioides renjunii]|uniref:CARDB domain-containing protein n=1 Tax=Nocardioides renjunii TaxID=3095075 RepID=UPI002AFFE711|nr:CARDB domain-containing protein [Nocardioides sp. S-34]WQQ20428.1 CARDB domain-containing protein [Nocardioides sp. S-34]
MLAAASLTASVVPAASAEPPTRPDLTTTSVTVTAAAKPGEAISVSTTVKNASKRKAPATRTTYALSTDTSAGGDITLPGTSKVKALKPGRSASVKTAVALPGSTPDGSYFVIACADAAKKVRESREKNNCRASDAPVEVSGDIEGTLSGTLTFTDVGASSTGLWDTWNRSAQATVHMSVSGPRLDEVFASTGSTYTVNGTRDDANTAPGCQRRRSETGGGTLAYTGNPYTDNVQGKFTKTDLSGLGLLVTMPYTAVTTESGCEEPRTTTSSSIDLNDITLTQVSRTATSVTYRVSEFLGPYSGTSEWDSITGDLVLTLT